MLQYDQLLTTILCLLTNEECCARRISGKYPVFAAGRSSPEVAFWTSDHASLVRTHSRSCFIIKFTSLFTALCLAQLSIIKIHKEAWNNIISLHFPVFALCGKCTHYNSLLSLTSNVSGQIHSKKNSLA